jgi:hypothetical protein
MAHEVDGAVGVNTDDIIHDAVGMSGSPRSGREAMRDFYRFTANFRTETEEHLYRFFEGDTMVLEQNMKGLSSVSARRPRQGPARHPSASSTSSASETASSAASSSGSTAVPSSLSSPPPRSAGPQARRSR